MILKGKKWLKQAILARDLFNVHPTRASASALHVSPPGAVPETLCQLSTYLINMNYPVDGRSIY